MKSEGGPNLGIEWVSRVEAIIFSDCLAVSPRQCHQAGQKSPKGRLSVSLNRGEHLVHGIPKDLVLADTIHIINVCTGYGAYAPQSAIE